MDDRGLYNPGQYWISQNDILGRVQGYFFFLLIKNRHLPYLGMVTIIMNDYPQLKVALLVILGLTTLLSKEEV